MTGPIRPGHPLPRRFYDRDPLAVAPELLGKVLAHGGRAGRIVEVEAYLGEDDAASHAFRGPTPRCATMFGPPGHLYVYFTYGMHFCANVVCQPAGVAGAVLLRALEPVLGIDEMRAARAHRARVGERAPIRRAPLTVRQLCSGPGRLCQALGINRRFDGVDLLGDDGIRVFDDGNPPPADPATGPRVGLGAAVGDSAGQPWRYWVPGDPHVSRPSASALRQPPAG